MILRRPPAPRPRRVVVPAVLSTLLLVGCGGGGSSATSSPRSIVYVALGASDAVGIGAVPLTKGYVYDLQGDLEALPANTALVNLGINGAEIGQIVAEELPTALAADPDVVTLWTGANDVVGGADPVAFGVALDQCLGALENGTHALVFVGDLPDLTQAPRFVNDPDPDVTPARVQAFNDQIATAVQAHGYVLVHLASAVLTSDLFFVDGFHPNNDGYAQIAAAFWAEMRPRL